jgi:hypothetical protein
MQHGCCCNGDTKSTKFFICKQSQLLGHYSLVYLHIAIYNLLTIISVWSSACQRHVILNKFQSERYARIKLVLKENDHLEQHWQEQCNASPWTKFHFKSAVEKKVLF